MSPLSSATAMKSAGSRRPRLGWSQRTSASISTGRFVAQVEDGLEDDDDLVAFDGPAELAFELESGPRSVAHRRLVELVPGLARRLGRVHRDVGAGHDVVGIPDAVVDHRDADARGDGDVAPDVERLRDPTEDPLGHLDRAVHVADLVEEDGELVAGQPARGVARPDGVGQPARDLDEEPIARAVTQRVVDRLEVVEVEEQDRRHRPVASPTCERVRDPIREQGPVGEPGERIVEGLVAQLGLELGSLGDVVGVDHEPGDRRVVEAVAGRPLEDAPATVAMGHPALARDVGAGRPAIEARWRDRLSRSSGWIASVAGRPTCSSGR